MSDRYTKIKSSYIMRTKHKNTDVGTIMERDWVTTNGLNVLRFGPGRRVWYNSGNFVFTTSNIPSYHKKHNLTSDTKEWEWSDCKDADGTVNEVKPNSLTNDIRDYAYYGSCSELIRATVEEIILDFPGRIVKTHYIADLKNEEDDFYELKNDFNIDLHHISVVLNEYDNPFRFLCETYDKYCIKTKKDDETNIEEIKGFSVDGTISNCIQDDEGFAKLRIIIETDKNRYFVYGCVINGRVVYCVKFDEFKDYDLFSIQPKEEYINEYFMNLSGFKGLLLRQDTKPLYTNNFKTPIEYNFMWFYPERKYTWPSDDYCIDVNSTSFEVFYSALVDIGLKMDELWTDNIYRSMTHESIKNFDWTYSRKYEDGDERDNVDGGERMIKILRIIGRVFDDIKFYIDSIKSTRKISYDNVKNCPEATLSDEVTLKGVDVISTIGSDYDINAVIEDSFLKKSTYVTKDTSWLASPYLSSHYKWYQTRNSNDIYPDVCDNELMRRFVLSFKKIMQTKGTQQSIDMLMSFFGFGRNPISPSDKDDYILEEEAFYTKKIIPFNECIDGKDEESKQVGEDWTNNPDLHVDFSIVDSNIKGYLINEINNNKDLSLLYYPDFYSGVPLNIVLLGSKNEEFVVPYFRNDLIYDGNFIFQGKGGWGKFVKKYDNDSLDDCFDYSETLSYLHVVGSIGELLSINPKVLNPYDIYYVASLKNYTEYDENPPIIDDEMTVSHYFVLMNQYESNKFYSWKNVPTKPSSIDGVIEKVDKETFEAFYGDDEYADWYYDVDDLVSKKHKDEEGYEPTLDDKMCVYSYVFKHLEYLESIMSTNAGNNPHVGYGNYDDGSEFLEYMEHPFKYSIENSLLNNISYENLAKMVNFDDIRSNRVTDKIQIMGKTKDENGYTIAHNNENGDENEITKVWYINTKVVTITNNVKQRVEVIDNDGVNTIIDGITYKLNKGDSIDTDLYERLSDEDKEKCDKPNYYFTKYFRQVILPYLIQVIPSTTILKLKGF